MLDSGTMGGVRRQMGEGGTLRSRLLLNAQSVRSCQQTMEGDPVHPFRFRRDNVSRNTADALKQLPGPICGSSAPADALRMVVESRTLATRILIRAAREIERRAATSAAGAVQVPSNTTRWLRRSGDADGKRPDVAPRLEDKVGTASPLIFGGEPDGAQDNEVTKGQGAGLSDYSS